MFMLTLRNTLSKDKPESHSLYVYTYVANEADSESDSEIKWILESLFFDLQCRWPYQAEKWKVKTVSTIVLFKMGIFSTGLALFIDN